jgi:hypothetical protein
LFRVQILDLTYQQKLIDCGAEDSYIPLALLLAQDGGHDTVDPRCKLFRSRGAGLSDRNRGQDALIPMSAFIQFDRQPAQMVIPPFFREQDKQRRDSSRLLGTVHVALDFTLAAENPCWVIRRT